MTEDDTTRGGPRNRRNPRPRAVSLVAEPQAKATIAYPTSPNFGLDEHRHAITPATARFPAPADLITFLAAEDAEPAAQIKPAC
jgi:hypothetical protein